VEWENRCREVLKQVKKALGPDMPVFFNAVKESVLPDYYRVVKKPIFLEDVERKLENGEYTSPQVRVCV